MVELRSPKPSIWVRILVPVLFFQKKLIKLIELIGGLIQTNQLNQPNQHTQPSMNKISAYFKDSYHELLEKVSWPSWEQLQQSTMVVLGATLLITAVVALMDFVANGSLKFIYSLFK